MRNFSIKLSKFKYKTNFFYEFSTTYKIVCDFYKIRQHFNFKFTYKKSDYIFLVFLYEYNAN